MNECLSESILRATNSQNYSLLISMRRLRLQSLPSASPTLERFTDMLLSDLRQ